LTTNRRPARGQSSRVGRPRRRPPGRSATKFRKRAGAHPVSPHYVGDQPAAVSGRQRHPATDTQGTVRRTRAQRTPTDDPTKRQTKGPTAPPRQGNPRPAQPRSSPQLTARARPRPLQPEDTPGGLEARPMQASGSSWEVPRTPGARRQPKAVRTEQGPGQWGMYIPPAWHPKPGRPSPPGGPPAPPRKASIAQPRWCA